MPRTQLTQVSINHFDRGKPFYPLVINYLVQLIGIKELPIRGIIGPESFESIVKRFFLLDTVDDEGEEKIQKLRDMLSIATGPLKLRSEFQGEPIIVDIDEIARDFADHHPHLLKYSMLSSGGLLILAHELSKDKPWYDRSPLWEFLRHCRNAAAHGGTFNLLGDEPRRSATWGSIEITTNLQGTNLFKDTEGAGLLSPGDPIRLLWDIEQEYPEMSFENPLGD